MASPFQSRPTPEYLAAVVALNELDWDNKTRAFAEASRPDLEQQAAAEAGRAIKIKSWRRLLGQKPREGDQLPGDDHVDLRMENKPVYASHPYQLEMDQLREIVRLCDENGLDVQIDARSWYFPSRTIRFSYRARSN